MHDSPKPEELDGADLVTALRDARERVRLLFDNAPIGKAIITPDGRFVEVNDALCELLGYSRDELLELSMPAITHPDDIARNLTYLQRQLAGELARYSIEKRYLRADGEAVWVVVSSSVVRGADGRPQFLIGQVEDISERKRAEEELRRSEARFRQVNESVPVGIYLLDLDLALVHYNQRLLELLDVGPDELLGKRWIEHFDAALRPGIEADVHRVIRTGEGDQVVARMPGEDGEIAWFRIGRRPMLDDDGRTVGLVGVVEDITAGKKLERRLAHQATHDHLTGLPNRRLLGERLVAALARAHSTRVGLLLCDLDQFKLVNDTLGHPAGDELLVAVASRVESVLRPGDTLGRFGGDELLIVCEGLESPDDATCIAARVAASLTEPIAIGDHDVFMTVSIGIALGDASGRPAEDLIRDADAAMYRAKEQGPGRYEVFDERLRQRALRRLETENALRHALRREELEVRFQPIVQIPSGTIVAFEALLCWHHPTRGLLSASAFIPEAESSGLIVPIGEWVLRRAATLATEWPASAHSPDGPSVSVNVSSVQIAHPTLTNTVAAVLAETGLLPSRLVLELTESSLLDDAEATRTTLLALKALGVRLALDDFGTGYSSLTHLQRFPVDAVKIDRTFVAGLARGERALVKAVLGIASSLGLTAVAEGVETSDHVRELVALGCEWAQGFLFARALPAERIGSLLVDQARPPFAQSGSALAPAIAPSHAALGFGVRTKLVRSTETSPNRGT